MLVIFNLYKNNLFQRYERNYEIKGLNSFQIKERMWVVTIKQKCYLHLTGMI